MSCLRLVLPEVSATNAFGFFRGDEEPGEYILMAPSHELTEKELYKFMEDSCDFLGKLSTPLTIKHYVLF